MPSRGTDAAHRSRGGPAVAGGRPALVRPSATTDSTREQRRLLRQTWWQGRASCRFITVTEVPSSTGVCLLRCRRWVPRKVGIAITRARTRLASVALLAIGATLAISTSWLDRRRDHPRPGLRSTDAAEPLRGRGGEPGGSDNRRSSPAARAFRSSNRAPNPSSTGIGPERGGGEGAGTEREGGRGGVESDLWPPGGDGQ